MIVWCAQCQSIIQLFYYFALSPALSATFNWLSLEHTFEFQSSSFKVRASKFEVQTLPRVSGFENRETSISSGNFEQRRFLYFVSEVLKFKTWTSQRCISVFGGFAWNWSRTKSKENQFLLVELRLGPLVTLQFEHTTDRKTGRRINKKGYKKTETHRISRKSDHGIGC